MSKVYKGWELIKAIESEDVKKGTKFRIKDFDRNVIYDGGDSLKFFDDSLGLENVNVCYVIQTEFEQIEEDTIDSIKEYTTTYAERCTDIEVREKINEIIKKVNQLDKQIKELKK